MPGNRSGCIELSLKLIQNLRVRLSLGRRDVQGEGDSLPRLAHRAGLVEHVPQLDIDGGIAVHISGEAALQAGVSLQQAVLRRDILLRAKELCLDLIRLNQLKALYGQRLKNAEELNALFDERFEKGDVNILEVNKVKMELMNLRATVAENDAAYRTALQNLLAMNGNMPLEFDETVYPLVPELRSLEQVRDEVMGADYALKQAQAGSEAARKLVKVNRHGWLPKLEVGYGREGGSDAMLNGFVVGVSVPIFSNRGKVKAARARQAGAELAQEQVAQQVEADIQSLFNEATRLRASMQAYDTGLMDKTLSALKQAVEAGQLSVLDYYSEAETVYASQEKLVDLENRYQKVVAQLYKNSL